MAERASSSVSEPNNRKEVAASYQNKGTFKTAKNIVKNRGLAGLYSGFSLHLRECMWKSELNSADVMLVRDTLGTGIYFMTYESSKQLLTTYRGDKSTTNPLAVVLAGGICGVTSWTLIYPIDSAKSIYQRNCLQYRKGEKVKDVPKIQFFNPKMYRGLGVSMGRSCLVNSIFFSVFEFIKKNINALED